MANHQMLDNVSHGTIKIKTGHSAQLGDNVSAAGVFPMEFSQLQLEYPIFFSKNTGSGEFEAVALLGFEPGENLFLNESGWDGDYVPLSIVRQPFLIGFQQRMENGVPREEPVVTIDMDHPRVNHKQGEPVFLPNGGTSEYLNHINSVLVTIHQGHQQRQQMIARLLAANLIEPFRLSLTFKNGEAHNLEGLYTIDEDRLKALDDATLVALHQQGDLQHVYMMLASIGNVRKLINRKDLLSAGN